MGPTRFILALESRNPTGFDPAAPPAIVTHAGATADWIVANHSGEVHAFHAQGLHFLLLDAGPVQWRDTVTVPAWSGAGAYPTVRLRMRFPSAGLHLVECSALGHAAGGMMMRVVVK